MIAYVEDKALEIPDSKDWTEVANAMRARVFPEVEIPEVDEIFEAVMRARREKQVSKQV